MLFDRIDGGFDSELHIAGASRTSLVEAFQDFREVVSRAPRIADDHSP
jgi:hypothetical protein